MANPACCLALQSPKPLAEVLGWPMRPFLPDPWEALAPAMDERGRPGPWLSQCVCVRSGMLRCRGCLVTPTQREGSDAT